MSLVHIPLLEWFHHVPRTHYCMMSLVYTYPITRVITSCHMDTLLYDVPCTHLSEYWSDTIMSLGHITVWCPQYTLIRLLEWYHHVPRTHYCMKSLVHTNPITGVIMSLGHITVWCPQYTFTGVIPSCPSDTLLFGVPSIHLSDYWSDSPMSLVHITVWCP